MNKYKVQKPFLKWIGGKTQNIDIILNKFPKEINNYHEPFLGGGSVLLALLSLQKQNKIIIKNKIYAYDINCNLINTFKNVQHSKDILFEYIDKYIKEYDEIKSKVSVNRLPKTQEEAKTSKESYYFWLKNKFNSIDKNSIECSALFMILNKLCFRGMYREGPNGFNVPFGNYKKTPTIITKQDLDVISDLIKDVIFIQKDFVESFNDIKEGDFVYLDPPYAPEKETSFVGYTKDKFTLETHNKLFNLVKEFNNKKIKFIMNNANVKIVLDAFKDYQYEEIKARRAIHCKKPGTITTELIIYN